MLQHVDVVGSWPASAFSQWSIPRCFILTASYASSSATSLSLVRSCDSGKWNGP